MQDFIVVDFLGTLVVTDVHRVRWSSSNGTVLICGSPPNRSCRRWNNQHSLCHDFFACDAATLVLLGNVVGDLTYSLDKSIGLSITSTVKVMTTQLVFATYKLARACDWFSHVLFLFVVTPSLLALSTTMVRWFLINLTHSCIKRLTDLRCVYFNGLSVSLD